MNYRTVAQIILNVTIISTFIGILFFTYGKVVEKQIVKNQSEYVAKSIAEDIKTFLPQSMKDRLIAGLEAPDMKEADANVKKSNDVLMNNAIKVLGILFAVGIVLTIAVCWWGGLKGFALQIVAESVVILVFVIITEIAFLNIIARKYNVADPNFVKFEMLTTLKEEFPLTAKRRVLFGQ